MDNDSTALPPPAQPRIGRTAPVSAVMVAGDAGATIARSLASILAQSVPPERVFVVVAGSRDDTFAVARTFNGRHAHRVPGPGPSSTTVTVIDRGPREDSLRSAYDFALRLVGDDASVLLVSPDAELDPGVLELLAAALDREPRVTTASARLDPRPTGRGGPLAAGLRLLQRHWAMGAVETGTDLGLAGPVPLAPATLLRLPAGDAAATDPRPSADGIVTALLAGADRTILVPGATARVDTAVSWATLRVRRDRWSASVGRLTRSAAGIDAGDRRRARLAVLRIGVGPVLRVLSYGLALLYLAAASLEGTLQPAWWWALPLLVRLPLHIRTLRKIRERTLADVVFGATYVPLELGESAYGVSRIRDGLRRLTPRGGRRPTPGSVATPWGAVDAVAAIVVAALVVVVLALAAMDGPAGDAATTLVGWAAVVVTSVDTAMALLRLLVARGGPFARSDDAVGRGRSAR